MKTKLCTALLLSLSFVPLAARADARLNLKHIVDFDLRFDDVIMNDHPATAQIACASVKVELHRRDGSGAWALFDARDVEGMKTMEKKPGGQASDMALKECQYAWNRSSTPPGAYRVVWQRLCPGGQVVASTREFSFDLADGSAVLSLSRRAGPIDDKIAWRAEVETCSAEPNDYYARRLVCLPAANDDRCAGAECQRWTDGSE